MSLYLYFNFFCISTGDGGLGGFNGGGGPGGFGVVGFCFEPPFLASNISF